MKGLFDPRGSSSLQVENAALDWFTAAFSVLLCEAVGLP